VNAVHGGKEKPVREDCRTLHPGDVVCAERGCRLETLLGSCVTLILTDPRRTVGAMCHVVHARPPLPGAEANTSYGDTALTKLCGLLRSKGIEPRLCEAFVYGGGNMFPDQIGPLASQGNVGQANANWALDRLHEMGIKIRDQALGGNFYRRVSWRVGDEEPAVTEVATEGLRQGVQA
jgi:chemotaxis protein CheD